MPRKIGSGEITNLPYLTKVAKLKKKVILSTGMSNIKEIKRALDILTSNGIPFRESHIAISKLTKKLEKEGKSISDLSGSELSKILGKDVDIDINISINSRNIVAGTSENRVKEEIKAAKKILNI